MAEQNSPEPAEKGIWKIILSTPRTIGASVKADRAAASEGAPANIRSAGAALSLIAGALTCGIFLYQLYHGAPSTGLDATTLGKWALLSLTSYSLGAGISYGIFIVGFHLTSTIAGRWKRQLDTKEREHRARTAWRASVLRLLSRDEDASVRLAVSENSWAPMDVFATLAEDNDITVRNRVLDTIVQLPLRSQLELISKAPRNSSIFPVLAAQPAGPRVLIAIATSLNAPMSVLRHIELLDSNPEAAGLAAAMIRKREDEHALRNEYQADALIGRCARELCTAVRDRDQLKAQAAVDEFRTQVERARILPDDSEALARAVRAFPQIPALIQVLREEWENSPSVDVDVEFEDVAFPVLCRGVVDDGVSPEVALAITVVAAVAGRSVPRRAHASAAQPLVSALGLTMPQAIDEAQSPSEEDQEDAGAEDVEDEDQEDAEAEDVEDEDQEDAEAEDVDEDGEGSADETQSDSGKRATDVGARHVTEHGTVDGSVLETATVESNNAKEQTQARSKQSHAQRTAGAVPKKAMPEKATGQSSPMPAEGMVGPSKEPVASRPPLVPMSEPPPPLRPQIPLTPTLLPEPPADLLQPFHSTASDEGVKAEAAEDSDPPHDKPKAPDLA